MFFSIVLRSEISPLRGTERKENNGFGPLPQEGGSLDIYTFLDLMHLPLTYKRIICSSPLGHVEMLQVDRRRPDRFLRPNPLASSTH